MNPIRVPYRGLGCMPRIPPAAQVPYAATRSAGLGALGLSTTTAVGAAGKGYSAGTAAVGIGTSLASAVGIGTAALPVIGTAIGLIVGLLASGIFNRQDQEVQNFDQAVAIFHQNPDAVINIANKYLVLAGLFDLDAHQIKGNIPIYKKYGRMGEERFVNDLVRLIYAAAQSGRISPNDTPQSIFSRIVQPWIDSFGYGAMQDANAEMINLVIMGMIAEYAAGLQTRWYSRDGSYPSSFNSLPKFSLPGGMQQSQAGAPVPGTPANPSPVIAPAQPVPPAQVLPAIGQSSLPAGFSLTPYQTYSGAGLYQGPDGLLYTLAGQVLTPFTGLRMIPGSGGQGFQHVTGGVVDPPQASQPLQTGPVVPVTQLPTAALPTSSLPPQPALMPLGPVPPSLNWSQGMGPITDPGYGYTAPGATTPTGSAPPQVATAGVSGSGAVWLAGLTVLGLLFATAHPAKPAKGAA